MKKNQETPARVALAESTNATTALAGVHYTLAHRGKMKGMISLSTYVGSNPYCKARHDAGNPDAICTYCFAHSLTKCNPSIAIPLKRNTEILTTHRLTRNEVPIINALIARFESFGELCNVLQVINYFTICKANPRTTFALWSKNMWLVAEALKQESKPKNLIIIESSYLLNKPVTPRYDFVDKVFTVYDKATAKANPELINCGARNCLACQRCYRHNPKGVQVEQINEKLK